MAKRKGVVPNWSQQFAYCVGLIVSDGNLSPDGRHITFVSKDLDLIKTFKEGLNLKVAIGSKTSGFTKKRDCFRVQFGNTALHEYLVSTGITPKKSLTIKELTIPTKYFWDFLRGCIDGDGNISLLKHPESSHLQLKLCLASGSRPFLEWVHETVKENSKVKGGWIDRGHNVYRLAFAKSDGIIILKKMYKNCGKWYLARKKEIADRILSV